VKCLSPNKQYNTISSGFLESEEHLPLSWVLGVCATLHRTEPQNNPEMKTKLGSLVKPWNLRDSLHSWNTNPPRKNKALKKSYFSWEWWTKTNVMFWNLLLRLQWERHGKQQRYAEAHLHLGGYFSLGWMETHPAPKIQCFYNYLQYYEARKFEERGQDYSCSLKKFLDKFG